MQRLHRQRNILEFALSSLLRYKGKNLTLLIAYALVVFVMASALFFVTALRHEAKAILNEAPHLIVQKVIAGRTELIEAQAVKKIARIRGISKVSGRLWGYYFDRITGANYTVIAVDNGSLNDDEAIIGSALGMLKKAEIREILPLRAYDNSLVPLQIVAILPASSNLISADTIIVSSTTLRKIFGIKPDYYTDIAVFVYNQRELPKIASKITDTLPHARVLSKDDILRSYNAAFHWRSGVGLILMLSCLLSLGFLLWDKATGLSAKERYEIAVLKAVGWTVRDVMHLKLWEALCVSLSGFFIGVIFAYVHVFWFDCALFAPAFKGWAILYPHFSLSPLLRLEDVLTIFAITVLPYVSAGIISAWQASILEPTEVLR